MSASIPRKAGDYALWLANFAAVASDNETALGLNGYDMTALNKTQADVNTAIANDMAAQANAKSVTKTNQSTLKASEKLLRMYAKKILADPNVSPALLKLLNLAARQPATHTPAVPPATLNVAGQTDGTNTLTWKKMSNKAGTIYQVEYQTNANGGWILLDTTTKTKYAATGFVPGQRTSYRVRAKRSDSVSAYSNEAVIYGNL